MKLNTNEQELVEIAVNGSVDHPRMRGFYTGYDGKGRRCVGTGGITYSHAIGDNCMQVAGITWNLAFLCAIRRMAGTMHWKPLPVWEIRQKSSLAP